MQVCKGHLYLMYCFHFCPQGSNCFLSFFHFFLSFRSLQGNEQTARLYKTYGWQTAAQDPSLGEGCRLVTSFFDIYENSYPTGAFM